MDFVTFLQVVRKHWKLVIVGLLFTFAAVVGVSKVMKPSYEAQASVLLYAPSVASGSSAASPTPPSTAAQNPLLEIGDLGVATEVMAQRMADPAVVERIIRQGAGTDWKVQQNTETRSPLLVVIADSASDTEAITTMKIVLAEVDHQLGVLQNRAAGSTGGAQITTQIVSEDTAAAKAQGSRVRAMFGVLVLGVLLSFSLPFAAEAIADSRRRPRGPSKGRARPGPSTGEGDGEVGWPPSSVPDVEARPVRWEPGPSGSRRGITATAD